MKRNWKKLLLAALVRSVRTFAQAAIAAIGTTALLTEVNWGVVFSTAGMAAALSILTSLAGLPEVPEEDKEVIEEKEVETDEKR